MCVCVTWPMPLLQLAAQPAADKLIVRVVGLVSLPNRASCLHAFVHG
jgi:hypothetical protein